MSDGTSAAPEPSERPILPGDTALDDPDPDQGALVGSWSWWPQTGRMLWSEAVCEILGLDPAITEPTLERALELVVPEQRREIRRLATSSFEQQTTIDTDVRIHRPDGQERTIHLVARAQVGEAGIPDHWWGTITDATDLPGDLREAVRSETAYRTLLRDLPAVVFRTKGDPVTGEVEFVGPDPREVLGYRPEPLRQDPELWQRSVHPDDRDAFAAARRRVVEQGQPEVLRYRFESGTTGEWIRLEAHLVPIHDEGGVTGVTGIVRRVTEDREDPSEPDEPAGERQAPDGIEELLGYREAVQRPRSPETVPLDPVAWEALDAVADRIGDVQAEVTVDELGKVEADRQDVLELFERLLDNAFRFRREDVPLEIELSSHVEDDLRIVSIADNGQGIPAGHHAEVFELFHTASEGGGPGGGLAICQRIVDAYDGEILVASTEGEGTVFSFSLPDAGASATATLGVDEG